MLTVNTSAVNGVYPPGWCLCLAPTRFGPVNIFCPLSPSNPLGVVGLIVHEPLVVLFDDAEEDVGDDEGRPEPVLLSDTSSYFVIKVHQPKD